MLAQWLRERDERKRQEAIDRVREEWQAWYQRMQAAQREGLPFDEPPPHEKDNSRKG